MRKVLLLLALVVTLLMPARTSAGGLFHATRHTRWTSLGRVFVTGYVERGYTATGTWSSELIGGLPQCAVNPAWVRYGSVIRVAGLWTCRATDTGNLGWAHVDLWVATDSQAYALTGYRQAWLRL